MVTFYVHLECIVFCVMRVSDNEVMVGYILSPLTLKCSVVSNLKIESVGEK